MNGVVFKLKVDSSSQKNYALVISWPDTKCKQTSSWYDTSMRFLKINKNGYYRVGHAALVLINGESGGCEYFDFGRYITPSGYGRLRSETTDPNLAIKTIVHFNAKGAPLNTNELISELWYNKACHGTGVMRVSLIPVNFQKAKKSIQTLKDRGFIPYGPFVLKGTNCSRMVKTVVSKSISFGWKKWLLDSFYLTPTPFGLIRLLGEYDFTEICAPVNNKSLKVLKQAQLNTLNHLSGTGAGAYFEINKVNNSSNYIVNRYDDEGLLESSGIYSCSDYFDLNATYELAYPSNSAIISIQQKGKTIQLCYKTKVEAHRAVYDLQKIISSHKNSQQLKKV